MDPSSPESVQSVGEVIRNYFSARSQTYVQLKTLQQQGWDSQTADNHFAKQRKTADTANAYTRKFFFKMMQRIAYEMHQSTGALILSKPESWILDICMAPGGFAKQMLKLNPSAQLRGFSLPPDAGGHLLHPQIEDERLQVILTDVTLLGRELGIDKADVPHGHPDASGFVFEDVSVLMHDFDIAFCDGQVLRTHKRADYREQNEATRLTCAQLVIALQHINPGGTLVILLHKADAWDTLNLLNTFDQFCNIQLFKPRIHHASRGSFYLVAQDLQPQSSVARAAISQWKRQWMRATFPYPEDDNDEAPEVRPTTTRVECVLQRFGARFVSLAEPIWEIQRAALARAPFMHAGGDFGI